MSELFLAESKLDSLFFQNTRNEQHYLLTSFVMTSRSLVNGPKARLKRFTLYFRALILPLRDRVLLCSRPKRFDSPCLDPKRRYRVPLCEADLAAAGLSQEALMRNGRYMKLSGRWKSAYLLPSVCDCNLACLTWSRGRA
jgi:hypothetical protein